MAQEFYGLFDSTTDDERAYTAAQLAQIFRTLGRSGVADLDGCLRVSAKSGMQTQVAPGSALLCGYVYALSDDGGAAKTFTHEPSAATPRIDRVVLRLDITGKSITLVVKTGVPSSSPVPPTLTRNATIYELSLAKVRIEPSAGSLEQSDITDERGDESVCGACISPALTRAALDGRYAVPMASAAADGMLSKELHAYLATLQSAISASGAGIDLGGKYIDGALFR